MFNSSELQEPLNALDESLIESAALETDLVTQLASDSSELTPAFGKVLESELSAAVDSVENQDTEHDLSTTSSTDKLFGLQLK